MKELMLELLTYEPFGEFLPEEETYISEILSGKDHLSESMFHDFFSDFYHCVQSKNFKAKAKGEAKDIDLGWLRQWKEKHTSSKSKRFNPTLLFKKICFYLIVRGKFTDKEFMGLLDLHKNLIGKWGIFTQFRRYAEADTYSVIKSYRNGAKKKYIVSTVKKLYYEAGRQVRQEAEQQVKEAMTLNKMSTFVDVFAGTASVAASMVTDGCPPPIINDFDPLMVCFTWAFTYYQKELRSRIAKLHNDLMKKDFNSTVWSYTEAEYEYHIGFIDSIMRLKPDEYWEDKSEVFWRKEKLTNEKIWDNFLFQLIYSKSKITKAKKKARRYKEFIIRIRSSYLDAKAKMDSCNKSTLRTINFNTLPKNQINSQVNTILEYALAVYYFYSFQPLMPNAFHVSCVDERNYYSYLKRLKVNLGAVRMDDQAVKAWSLTKLRLRPASLKLESIGNFSRYLRGARFYSQDFRNLLQNGPADGIYYLDSPYFLTTGYEVGFSDDDHKDMLELLRNADFKWIFSMQYYPSNWDECTSSRDEAERKKQAHIIKNYGAYYRGFYSPFQLKVSHHLKAKLHLKANHRLKVSHHLKAIHQRRAIQRVYIPKDTSKQAPSNLYAILFDNDAGKGKRSKVYKNTTEMLVVNFNCLPAIPLHDSAVVLPFDGFLKCADAGMAYQDIVQRAITWRENNITSNYSGESPV